MKNKPSEYLARDIYMHTNDIEATEETLEDKTLLRRAVEAAERQESRELREFIIAMERMQQAEQDEKIFAAANAPGGGIVQTSRQRVEKMAERLPANERKGIESALAIIDMAQPAERATAERALEKALQGRARTETKAAYDRRRRTLVGARVNREFAELCKIAAESAGQSVTKWCYAALSAALKKQIRTTQSRTDDYESPYLL